MNAENVVLRVRIKCKNINLCGESSKSSNLVLVHIDTLHYFINFMWRSRLSKFTQPSNIVRYKGFDKIKN